MRAAALPLIAGAFVACGGGEPVPRPARATAIISTTASSNSFLKGGTSFSVTANGSGVVSAIFGPREISRFVTNQNPTAVFSADELPEGGATLLLRLQRTFGGDQSVPNVWIDRTAPEVVRVENAAVGPGKNVRLLLWDAVMLQRAEVKVGAFTHVEHFSLEPAQSALVPLEIPGDALPEGEWSLEVLLEDAAENQSAHEQSIVVDRTLPTAQFLAPAPGTELSGQFEVRIFAEDNVKVASVELRASGSLVAIVAGGTSVIALDASLFPVGELVLEATPRDLAGNVGATPSVLVQVR
jgi:hypothetical protein